MNIGILCPSDIAFRRFMPALVKISSAHFVGIGINSPSERYGSNLPDENTVTSMLESASAKAMNFIENYGGRVFSSYEEIISSDEIDAIYIPLPPGLHHKWTKKALLAGKHVLVEKPSTTRLIDTQELISLADEKGLALHENYMFNFHSQLDAIDEIVKNGDLGEVRLYRISFGFPMRAANDFRYVRALGGGALLDAGGYTIKYATRLLGNTARIAYSQLNNKDGFEVDMHGSGALVNENGVTAQIAFGMDNDYRCELEVWASAGTLKTGRVLTAPVGFEPILTISRNGAIEEIKLASDDAFEKSILRFLSCVENENVRKDNYKELEKQSSLVEDFFNLSK